MSLGAAWLASAAVAFLLTVLPAPGARADSGRLPGATLVPAQPAAPGEVTAATGKDCTVADMPGTPGRLVVSRIDVSRHPEIGAVVTAPPGLSPACLPSRLTVRIGDRSVRPTVNPLSPQDLEVVVVPDRSLTGSSLATERTVLTRLLMDLPSGARTGVLDDPGAGVRNAPPTMADMHAPRLSADPTDAVRTAARLGERRPVATPAAELEVALGAFSRGPQVRRTLVLVSHRSTGEDPAILAHLRQRLAASGTQLFVLDLSPTRTSVAGLAAATGGFAVQPETSRTALAGLLTPAMTDPVISALQHQYYVRFADPRPLPGVAELVLPAAGGATRSQRISLPAANPVAPPPWTFPVPPRMPAPWRVPGDSVLVGLAVLLVGSGLLYGGGMLVASRREPSRRPSRRPDAAARAFPALGRELRERTAGELFFVFLLPCLDEERVIGASVRRLLSFPGDNIAIMVIDDDSTDATADVVTAITDERVRLLRRRSPDARQGKGEALNAAVRELVQVHQDLAGGREVIVVVVDADGRLDPHALQAVAPHFADPAVGAVQTGVRISNRHSSRLARMQDMEFVIHTEVFQRGRRHLNSVGLGGNGQFMRLSALLSLGPSPWSRSLTEDLDLGVRLLVAGWRNEFCAEVAVHQQGLLDLRRLARQRTRWFQGHLQSWRLLPLVLRGAPPGARGDLIYHLSSPFLLLVTSLLTASFAVSAAISLALTTTGVNPLNLWTLSTYLLAFGPASAYTLLYWRTERVNGLGPWRAWGLAHLYVIYGLTWYVAGWRAVTRTVRGRTGWAKTERSAEAPGGHPRQPVGAGAGASRGGGGGP